MISSFRNHLQLRWLLSLVALPLLSACGSGEGGPPMDFPVTCSVYETRPEKIVRSVNLVGSLVADETLEIRAELDGTITAIRKEEGASVVKGDVLFELESEKLRAEVRRAEADLQLATRTLDRNKSLIKQRTISRQEFDSSESDFNAKKAELERLREALSEATVVAPFDGVLGSRLVSPGQYVNEGQQISSLVKLSPIKVEAQVPERYFSSLEVGQELALSLAAYPEEDFAAKVFFIAPDVDASTRTILVKASAPNASQKLLPGMFAEVSLILETRTDAIVIPESAVLLQSDQQNVYVVTDEGKADIRPVTTGEYLPGRVEITEGLQAGEFVVTNGLQKVRPGSTIIPSESSDLLSKPSFAPAIKDAQ